MALASCSGPGATFSAIPGGQPARLPDLSARQLVFDRDTVSDVHFGQSLFVKGAQAQYLFPSDAVALKSGHRVIIQAYDHIFVFPDTVGMRRLTGLEHLRVNDLQAFYRATPRLEQASTVQSNGGEQAPAPSPQCPDCVAYADSRMYRKGVLVGYLNLPALTAQNATTLSRRVNSVRDPLRFGDPGICGNPMSSWYYDPNCVTDYYLLGGGNTDNQGPVEVIIITPFTTDPFRSSGVTSYTWSNSKQQTVMLANWNGFDYANLYHVYHAYTDITGNAAFSYVDWNASYYGKTMEFDTDNSHTFLSRTDVIITSVQTAPNGTQTSIQEPARYAIVATPIT